MSDVARVPAAVRYKEMTASATSAAEQMRKHEAQKSDRLNGEVVAGRERVSEAEQAEEEVAEGVRLRWNAALEALWDERWLQVTRIPDADRSASPDTADKILRKVQAAYLELHESLGKPRRAGGFLRRGGRGPGSGESAS